MNSKALDIQAIPRNEEPIAGDIEVLGLDKAVSSTQID